MIHQRCMTGWRNLGADLLVETIPRYVSGEIRPQPQPADGSTYAAKIKKQDGTIDWRSSAEKIWCRLRAFTPWPGAFTFLTERDKKLVLKFLRAEVGDGLGEPGTIISADKTGIVVACGENSLRVLELQREGGKRLAAADFLSGCPLQAGDRLG